MYTFRTLNLNDIVAMDYCLRLLTQYVDRNMFIPPEKTYIEKILTGYGKSAGVFFENTLIGFASIVYPRSGSNNLGRMLGLSVEDIYDAIQLEHLFILNQHQGLGLSSKLLNYLLSIVDFKYDQIFSTINPLNVKSLSLAFKFGFAIVSVINFRGYLRYLMRKKNNCINDINFASVSKSVEDIESIAAIIKKGFFGCSFNETKNKIFFKRMIW